jgi:hypothetical protein
LDSDSDEEYNNDSDEEYNNVSNVIQCYENTNEELSFITVKFIFYLYKKLKRRLYK